MMERMKAGLTIKRVLYLGVGFVAVGAAMAGVFLPLVPTVPFLLLAAYCFARSSRRFHSWLLNHPWFGTYLRNYRDQRGMTFAHKFRTLALLWGGIGFSLYAMRGINPNTLVWIAVFLGCVLIGVTAHVLTLKTVK